MTILTKNTSVSPTSTPSPEIGRKRDETLEIFAYEKNSRRKGRKKRSMSLDTTESKTSESATMMSTHAMKMGCYSINLGTETGQRLQTLHLVILPLIPVLILLIQNYTTYTGNSGSINDLNDVFDQVNNALDFAELTRRLQEERVTVALNFFIRKRENITTVVDFDRYVEQDLDKEFLRGYRLERTFNNTDEVLQRVRYWPNIAGVSYFKTKLKFQIKHSLFRTKIQEGDKTMKEVLEWYNAVNSQTLNYVTYSIHDSDISDFYRWIIGYKNLLKAVEFAGKAGIIGIEYFSDGLLQDRYEYFLEFDVLRREYLNQTFNFIPGLQEDYEGRTRGNTFELSQRLIAEQEVVDRELQKTIAYVIQFLKYANSVRDVIIGIASKITQYVQNDMANLRRANILPLCFIVVLVTFIPICVIFTLNITSSMTRYSRLYNEKVEVYNVEKKKTENLLGSLLPRSIIKKMKKGQIPKPEVFDNTTIFFCDIVSFTNIASESTAHQIIEFLNDLYILFDDRLDNFDVYKVETIGDAYMIASGIPVSNGTNHAVEIGLVSLDLLAKVLTFEIKHKPGFRLKLRMGIHSGQVVGGIVGKKIPHYSIFGETVEIAGLMESTGQPMKIQMSEATKDILDKTGGFTHTPRGTVHLPTVGNFQTHWLIGRKETEHAGIIET